MIGVKHTSSSSYSGESTLISKYFNTRTIEEEAEQSSKILERKHIK